MSPLHAPAGGPRGRRLARAIVAAMAWALVAGFAWFMWPTWLGGQTTIIAVSGKSMEPLYHGGDIVIARSATPKVGDIVIYRPEGYEDAKIVHRIIGGNGVSGWEMRGDNNDFTDPFTPANDAVIGVARIHIPHAGAAVALVTKPWVWGAFLLGMVSLLLWPSKDDDQDDDEDGPGDPVGDELDPDALTLVERGVLAMIVAVAGAFSALTRAVRRRGPRTIVGGVGIALVATLLSATLVGAPQLASASGLNLSAVGATHSPAIYCWPSGTSLSAALTGTSSGGNYTQLKVSSMPSACSGKAMSLNAYSSSGALLATGSGTAGTGDVTITTTAAFTGANVAYVVVTIGSPRAAAITAAPVGPATCAPTDSNGNAVSGTCTVTNVTITDTWGSVGARNANATFTANSSSGYFKVTFNFSQAPFPGWYPHSITGNLTLPPTTGCSALPLVTVGGPSWSNSQAPGYAYYFQFSENGGNICP